MSMVERVARAMFDRYWSSIPDSPPAWTGDSGPDYWMWLATAAIKAISDAEPIGLREALDLIKDMLPLIEPARLREEAAALEGSIQRMPVRQIVRRAKTTLAAFQPEQEAIRQSKGHPALDEELESIDTVPYASEGSI